MLLSGKTALVLGYGRVGTLVGRACSGLGLKVVGVRASIKKEYTGDDGVDVHPVSCLDSLLPKVDVLMVTVPGTASTSGMIDKRRLNLLPKGAILVNVGRGSVINEQVETSKAIVEKKLLGLLRSSDERADLCCRN